MKVIKAFWEFFCVLLKKAEVKKAFGRGFKPYPIKDAL
jgi:hypothetical protein